MFRELLNRLESRLRRRKLDAELDDEMRFHLEMQIEKNIAAGMAPEEARRVALRDFGGATQMKEACRDARHTWLDSVWQDVRYAFRSFRRDRAFTITAILTLAIGIGATTSTYSIVDGILFRPLPYKDPDRVVLLLGRSPRTGSVWEMLSQPAFTALHRSRSFDAIVSYETFGGVLTTTGGGQAETIDIVKVSSDFFRVLGVYPFIGRAFSPDEGGPDKRVGVLTYAAWQQRFGGDRSVVGRTVAFQEQTVTIVGILPADFWYPRTTAKDAPGIILAAPVNWSAPKGGCRLLGRLKPGVGIAQAQAEARVISATLAEMKLRDGSRGEIFVTPLRSMIAFGQRQSLLAVLGAVLFLLLIACVNVANLMLARGRQRQREFAIRGSLGAGRLRIARQLITESALVGLVGAIVGVLSSYWTFDLLLARVPEALRPVRDIGIDHRVLAFAAMVTVGAVALFGIVPALDASKPDLMFALKTGVRERHRLRRVPLRGLLLVAEVGLALVLLVGAGLLVNSFMRLQHVDVGFDPANLTIVHTAAPKIRYPTDGQVTLFYERVMDRLRRVPGVESAATVDVSPLNSAIMADLARIEGRAGEDVLDTWRVGSGYFETLGIRLLDGRPLTPRDEGDSASVAVVNETMARRFWPGSSPIGRHVVVWPDTQVQIVGVVGDTRSRLRDYRTGARAPVLPTVFVPFDAKYARGRYRTCIIRVSPGHGNVARSIKAELAALDREMPVTPTPLGESMMEAVAAPRFYALVVGLFAAIGLVLSAVGIAGVAAHDVLRRTHEIGVRMALGASARRVVAAITTQVTVPVAIGLALGIGAALALTRVLASLLFEIKPRDPLIFAAVSVLLAAVALLATWLPARRAACVDPIEVLRAE